MQDPTGLGYRCRKVGFLRERVRRLEADSWKASRHHLSPTEEAVLPQFVWPIIFWAFDGLRPWHRHRRELRNASVCKDVHVLLVLISGGVCRNRSALAIT